MNYIKEAENMLEKYRLMEKSIKNLKGEMDSVEKGMRPSDKVVASLEQTGVKGGKSRDINDIFRYYELKKMREETQEYLDRIDCILNDISLEEGTAHYGKLLRLWYIDKTPKEEILEILYYENLRTIYNHRDKAIERFAIAFFGLRAAQAT